MVSFIYAYFSKKRLQSYWDTSNNPSIEKPSKPPQTHIANANGQRWHQHHRDTCLHRRNNTHHPQSKSTTVSSQSTKKIKTRIRIHNSQNLLNKHSFKSHSPPHQKAELGNKPQSHVTTCTQRNKQIGEIKIVFGLHLLAQKTTYHLNCVHSSCMWEVAVVQSVVNKNYAVSFTFCREWHETKKKHTALTISHPFVRLLFCSGGSLLCLWCFRPIGNQTAKVKFKR